MDQVLHYFNQLTETQIRLLKELKPLYEEWNAQINVISRKDMDHFYEHHVLHSFAIAKFIQFDHGDRILDVGTGGGFPGIPLAILFPDAHFHLIDSIGKKIKVVREIVEALELKNVSFEQQRAEKHMKKYHYIVSRAVTDFRQFAGWTRNNFSMTGEGALPAGWIALKGGDLAEEFAGIRHAHIEKLNTYFKEEFFQTKKLVYVPHYALKKK